MGIAHQYLIPSRQYNTNNINLNKYTRMEIHKAIVIHAEVSRTLDNLIENIGKSNEEHFRLLNIKACNDYRDLPHDFQNITIIDLNKFYMNKYHET